MDYSFRITVNEMEVYRSLLKTGSSTISSISKNVHMNQRSVYDYIERLIFKGLVGQIWHNNKRQFLALNPKMLNFLIEEEKKRLNLELRELKELSEDKGDDLKINIIREKKDFLRILRVLSGKGTVFLPEKNHNFSNNPAYKLFLLKNKPIVKCYDKTSETLKSDACCIIIFIEDYFIIYSIIEEKGFYSKNKDFAKSLKVYFV